MNTGKEVTIYDIARLLNLSSATVSRGLKNHPSISQKTKDRIKEMAESLGYRSNTFASSLRLQKTNTIGVIIPRFNSSFMSDVIAGMEKVANNCGYNLIISQSLESEKKEIVNAATMFQSRVDGLMVSLAYNSENISHFEPFMKKNIPVIFFDRVFSHEKCSAVIIDNFRAGYDMTSHLISQGSKNIFHITGNLNRNVYKERFEGYKQALADNKILFNPMNIIINNLNMEDGIEAAQKILQLLKKPDGIFVTNDFCAASCMLELKKNGVKIPQEILIGGFNNDPISALVEPNLTTIDYKGFEMGEMTAQTLINHLTNTQNLSLTQTIVMRHELIIRQSSIKQ